MSHRASNWLADLPPEGMSHAEFRVMFHLCDAHNSKRDPETACFPSQATLLTVTGLSNGGLNKALSNLEKNGFLRRRRTRNADGTRGPTYYILGVDMTVNTTANSTEWRRNQLHSDASTNSTLAHKPTPLSVDKPVKEPLKEPAHAGDASPDGASRRRCDAKTASEIAKHFIARAQA